MEEHRPQSKAETSILDSSTVLFDENRFLLLKNLREQGHYTPLFPQKTMELISNYKHLLSHADSFALSIEDFDLILKSFLRTQSMSTYISSLPKSSMAYW